MNIIAVEIQGEVFTLKPHPFENNINIKDFLEIDYHNIFGELVTMPLVLNQIANMKAEVDNQVAHQKAGLEILKANLEKQFKESSKGEKRTTLNDLDNYVLTNEQYQKERSVYIDLQKQASYLDSFYWSATKKIDALSKISDKISPEEFNVDILERNINNVIIKKFKGKI